MKKVLFASVDDVGPVLRLKELIGSDRVGRFRRGEHPLAAGFEAIRKKLIGTSLLTIQEVQELGAVDFVARALQDREIDWKDNRQRLASDLAKATECAAVVFELQVIKFALEGGPETVVWQRYTEGVPDVTCSNPDMRIECKLIRTRDIDKDSIFDSIAAGIHQHRTNIEAPLVIAVGFVRNLPPNISQALQQECYSRGNWFAQRPDISGALIFLPRATTEPIVEALGLRRVGFMEGWVLEVVNHRAALGLPVGFSSLQKR